MCLAPLLLKTQIYKVPCGKCISCLRRKQNAWAFRLQQQLKVSTSACFITLTYENIPISSNGMPTLVKKDFQNFLKRIRKKTYGQACIKYYACGEYGTISNRPHYHAIMFNLPQVYMEDSNILTKTWGKGHINISPCNTATIRYTTKYLLKGKGKNAKGSQKEFSLMSKYLGVNYLTPQMIKYHKENLQSFVTLPGGIPTSLPRYFRDKIFDEQEKELLNEVAEEVRKVNFTKLFNRDYNHQLSWKEDQRRKSKKQEILERSLV